MRKIYFVLLIFNLLITFFVSAEDIAPSNEVSTSSNIMEQDFEFEISGFHYYPEENVYIRVDSINISNVGENSYFSFNYNTSILGEHLIEMVLVNESGSESVLDTHYFTVVAPLMDIDLINDDTNDNGDFLQLVLLIVIVVICFVMVTLYLIKKK